MKHRKERRDDVESAGRSELVPYKEGESTSARHQRRLSSAYRSKEDVERWCEECDLQLKITNGGHHWRFIRDEPRVFVEWWPSSAKMVIDKKYHRGIHCHDYAQVMKIMEDRLGIRKLAMLKIKFKDDVILGPSRIFKITGNFMRQGGDSRIVARYSKHFWHVGDNYFTAYSVEGPLTVHFEDLMGGKSDVYGPFTRLVCPDGVMHINDNGEEILVRLSEESQLWHCFKSETYWPLVIITAVELPEAPASAPVTPNKRDDIPF